MTSPVTPATPPRWSEQVRASVLYRRVLASPDADFWGDQEARYRLWLAHNDYVEKVVGVIGPKLRPADRIFDIGGGSGALAIPLADKVRWMTVVEPSRALCKQLIDDAAAAGCGNVAALPATLEALPDVPNYVESTIMGHTFDAMPEPHDLLKKLFRGTRRNMLFVTGSGDPHPLQQEVWRRFRETDYPAPPGLPALTGLVREVGFRPVVETFTATDNLVYRDLDDAVEQWAEELGVDGGVVDRASLRRLLQVWLVRMDAEPGGPPPEGEGVLGVRSMTTRAVITCWPGE